MTAFAEPETLEQTLPGSFLWMRAGAKRHYVGDVELDPNGLSLLGHENSLSIEALIRIPFAEVQRIRLSDGDAETVAGVPGVVLELTDGTPIFLRAMRVSGPQAAALAAKLERALERA
jgi:hypothetical protein